MHTTCIYCLTVFWPSSDLSTCLFYLEVENWTFRVLELGAWNRYQSRARSETSRMVCLIRVYDECLKFCTDWVISLFDERVSLANVAAEDLGVVPFDSWSFGGLAVVVSLLYLLYLLFWKGISMHDLADPEIGSGKEIWLLSSWNWYQKRARNMTTWMVLSLIL